MAQNRKEMKKSDYDPPLLMLWLNQGSVFTDFHATVAFYGKVEESTTKIALLLVKVTKDGSKEVCNKSGDAFG